VRANSYTYTAPVMGGKSVLLSLLIGTLTIAAHAQTLRKPTGPVLLTVSGLISQRNAGDSAAFDSAMLNALPVSQIVTKTPWHAAPAKFSGPALKAVLNAVGAKGKVFRLTALDKYEGSIPVEDIERYDPILALRLDGKELNIRNRGPILLMYPFDSYPQIDTDVYYGRSVWQLLRIVVE